MSRQYAFLMIDYDTPELIKDIQKKLTDDDLYVEKDNDDFGIEDETHVTLVPCLDNDIDLNELKKLLKPLKDYEIMLRNISLFRNDKYDVLKCDVVSMNLIDTNRKITDRFTTHSDFKEYHPHTTIAYVKKDHGDNFTEDLLSPMIVLKPKCFHFSYVDDNGKEKDITFK